MKGVTDPLEGKQRASVTGPGVRKNEAIVPEINEDIIDTPNRSDVFKYIGDYLNQNLNTFIENFYHICPASSASRAAYCKDPAGAATTIQAYLDTDGTGEEVTVNCSIAGGGNLNDAIPRLTNGLLIIVDKIGDSWYCKTVFQAVEVKGLEIISGKLGGVRKAYCKAPAGVATTITCYLDTDGTGTEITVNFEIAGGGNCNAAIPRLADGDMVSVMKIGSVWWCTTTLQASEDCDCYSE